MDTPDGSVRELEIEPRSIVVALAAVGAVLAAAGMAAAIPRTVVYVLLGVFLALALDPIVVAVRRRLGASRTVAVVVVLSIFAALVALVAVFVVPAAVRQSRDLGDELPQVVRDLGDLPVVGDELVEREVPARVEEWIEDLPERLSVDATPLERLVRTLTDGALAGAAVFLVAVGLLLDGEHLVGRVRRLVRSGNRERADRMASVLYRSVGRYAAGSVFVAVIAGVAILVVGLALGIPLTPLVAIWVAVWNLVPQIGGAVGGVPFVLLAFTQGVGTGVVALAFFVVYLQLENHVISPVVVGQAIRLSPLATMIAALVGVAAGGVVGALLAVPLTGAVKMIALGGEETP